MSSRARRIANPIVEAFDWGRRAPAGTPQGRVAEEAAPAPAAPPAAPPVPAVDLAQQQARLAALEREAFAKGYEQGERAGAEAGTKRADAMLRRLAQTLEELGEVRRAMIRQTERQLVELALAIARRIVRREVAIDQDLTLTLARVALERLGDSTAVTIRLHPADYAATSERRDTLPGGRLTVVADPAVSRGGCLVESDFGYVDASVDAQFQELARALLVEEGQEQPVVHGAR